MRFLLDLARRDLAAGGSSLWVFRACLALGVALVAATGGLYQQVAGALMDDTRALAGGDVEVESRRPLSEDVLAWMNANGTVSLLTELRTMMRTGEGGLDIVELQSVDDNYPLYGELLLEPAVGLAEATAFDDGRYGIALDPVLAERLDLDIGDTVGIGALTLEVRALIRAQPDRSLAADWRGPPVLIDDDALAASGLVTPASRIEFEYRVRTDGDADAWTERFLDAFPRSDYEVQTFIGRGERIAERLGQVASGLMIIGFSTLFIGGLGVFNSIQAWLQGRLGTIATLRALGLRNRRLAGVYLVQVALLAGGASIVGAAIGLAIAAAGAWFADGSVPVAGEVLLLAGPALVAVIFGLLVAFTCSLPAIGRALSVQPAALFRSIEGAVTETPREWWLATLGGSILIALLVLAVLPDPLFGLAFIAVVAALVALLELIVLAIKRLAHAFESRAFLGNRFALRLALANLHRPGSPLGTSLVSLGSALTLLVSCTIVVGALLVTLNETIPDESPALVLYDVQTGQLDAVTDAIEGSGEVERVQLAPLVLGRIAAVNGELLRDSDDDVWRVEARNEHKLTYRADNIDDVTMDRGRWWDDGASGARVAMEDREADRLGLQVGDELIFDIDGRPLEVVLDGIYRQKGMQTRFWFEAIFSNGALDPMIHRHVGAAWMSDAAAVDAQARIAEIAPNVVSVRTASILAAARDLLGKASAALAVVAAVSLAVSLMVLAGVVATSRARQVYDATILHAMGARLSAIRQSLRLEYLLLALVTSLFALAAGSAIAVPLVEWRLRVQDGYPLWPAVIVALAVSAACLDIGARYLLRRLALKPAALLRSGG